MANGQENKKRPNPEMKFGKYTSRFPLLMKRCKEYGIEMPSFFPNANDAIIWRLPQAERTSGGLIIPDTAKSPHTKGVLLLAGLDAMDFLFSRGIQPGHIVTQHLYAGWEMNDKSPERVGDNRILIVAAREIAGSDDVMQMLEDGTMDVGMLDGKHCLSTLLLPEDPEARKKKLRAVADDESGNPQERETAARLAAGK